MAKNKLDQKTITRLLNDRSSRIGAVRKSHLLFFYIYFAHYITYEIAPFQLEMFDLTEDKNNKMCVLVSFRDSGKSTIITTSFVLWSILGMFQSKFVLIISQTHQKAQQHLRNIKVELETNEVLKKDLGPFEEESDQWGVNALNIKQFDAKIAIGSVDQTIRGIRHRQYRPDLIILDDVEDTASVRTQEGRDKTWNWFTGEIIPLGCAKTRIFTVGNLLHRDSFLKRLEKNILTGQTDGNYRQYPIITPDNTPAWPGKFLNLEAIEQERRKVMNRIAWHREYLLDIISDDDQIILEDWIQYYDELPEEKPLYSAIGIDPAVSQNGSADCTAMVPAHIYGSRKNLRIYILPGIVNKRLTTNELIKHATSLYSRIETGYYLDKIYVEEVGFQKLITEEIKRSNCRAEGVSVGTKNKGERLSAVSYLLESGKVYFPRNKNGETLINQIIGLGTEKHDDLVDALTLLLYKIAEKDRQQSECLPYSIPPREEELRHLNSRERKVIMDKYRDYVSPNAM
jgi:predicted phage terminase large subunit-like protein